MMEELTKHLDSYLEMGVPGYDCIVYHNGSCIYRKFGGYSDLEAKTPMNGKETYYLYSCSKPITCVAALQLYERGLFRLDDLLCEYIPEFSNMSVRTPDGIVPAKNKIKIRDLFTMTAGFSYDMSGWAQEVKAHPEQYSTLDAIRLLATEPLLYDPGTEHRYSFCHDVLAACIEVIIGKRFGDYVKENVFDPLGMHHSTFNHAGVPNDSIAPQYVFRDGKAQRRFGNDHLLCPDFESGGAGCISTVEDYILFLEALRKGDILISSETTDLMTTNTLTDALRNNSKVPFEQAIRMGYGYGLGVRCPAEGMPYTDFGWGGAAGSYLAIDRQNGISVFMAEHLLSSPSDKFRHDIISKIKEDLKL